MLEDSLIRWDAPAPPTQEQLERLIIRQGFLPSTLQTLSPSAAPIEETTALETALLVFEGRLQIALPGFGVLELGQGDQFIVPPQTLYELKALDKIACQYFFTNARNGDHAE